LAKVIATAQHALPRSALNWLSDIPARVIRERYRRADGEKES
jgi:hypothetical protein